MRINIKNKRFGEMATSMEDFLLCLRQSANQLNVKERQRILRLVVKEIIIGTDTITIKHSIPYSHSKKNDNHSCYLLRGGSRFAFVRQYFSALCT